MNPLTIIKYIREHRLTKNEFCKMCNIKLTLLDSILYYGNNIEYSIAERIANTMNIGVYELYTFD